jgi:hypothetical protein
MGLVRCNKSLWCTHEIPCTNEIIENTYMQSNFTSLRSSQELQGHSIRKRHIRKRLHLNTISRRPRESAAVCGVFRNWSYSADTLHISRWMWLSKKQVLATLTFNIQKIQRSKTNNRSITKIRLVDFSRSDWSTILTRAIRTGPKINGWNQRCQPATQKCAVGMLHCDITWMQFEVNPLGSTPILPSSSVPWLPRRSCRPWRIASADEW